jgi:hypothetical protein
MVLCSVVSASAGDELRLELVLGHAGLLGADVLHVQAEDAGELGQVVGVAAGGDAAAAPGRARTASAAAR